MEFIFGFELEREPQCLFVKRHYWYLRLWPLDLDLVFKSHYQSLLVMSTYILVEKDKSRKNRCDNTVECWASVIRVLPSHLNSVYQYLGLRCVLLWELRQVFIPFIFQFFHLCNEDDSVYGIDFRGMFHEKMQIKHVPLWLEYIKYLVNFALLFYVLIVIIWTCSQKWFIKLRKIVHQLMIE